MNCLMKDNWPSVLFAMAGGLVLSIGNLSTQYAWAYVGLSVTEVICASMVVVIGKFVNILTFFFWLYMFLMMHVMYSPF